MAIAELRQWQGEQRRRDRLEGYLRISGQDFVTGFEEKEREREDVLIPEVSVLAHLGDGDTINCEREYRGNSFLCGR